MVDVEEGILFFLEVAEWIADVWEVGLTGLSSSGRGMVGVAEVC